MPRLGQAVGMVAGLGDAQIAGHRQLPAAAHRRAVERRDDRLRHGFQPFGDPVHRVMVDRRRFVEGPAPGAQRVGQRRQFGDRIVPNESAGYAALQYDGPHPVCRHGRQQGEQVFRHRAGEEPFRPIGEGDGEDAFFKGIGYRIHGFCSAAS